jgi:hypothetical protein
MGKSQAKGHNILFFPDLFAQNEMSVLLMNKRN